MKLDYFFFVIYSASARRETFRLQSICISKISEIWCQLFNYLKFEIGKQL